MTTRDFSTFTERYGWPEGEQKFPFCIGHRGLASGNLRLAGDRGIVERFRRLFPLPQPRLS